MIFYSLIISFSVVTTDALIQLTFKENILGYSLGFDGTIFITSFFDQEKKLGSYLVRFLPMILGLCFFFDLKIYKIYYFIYRYICFSQF